MVPTTRSHRETSCLVSVDFSLHLVVHIIDMREDVLHLLIWSWRDRIYVLRYLTLIRLLVLGEGLHMALLRLFGFKEVGAHVFRIQP